MYKLRTILLALTITLGLTACDKGLSVPVPKSGEVSIAYLKSLCTHRTAEIHSDITISGVVVANDWLGEYYKSIVVVDDSGGIQVAIDGYNIYRQLPIFSRITIFCNGMTLGRIGGKVELGARPTADFIVDNIPSDMLHRYIRIDDTAAEPECVRRGTIGEMSVTDITTVVQFDDVRIVDSGRGTWCEMIDGEFVDTIREVVDTEGVTLPIRIRGRCDYAGEAIPVGRICIKGVVDYAGGEYFLRIINYGVTPSDM
ncbi:MAG: hypothetical protein IJ348_04770 [Alistipes sp.]|nr:hypothetical protein [Alistipes sp.]